jgi:RNA polymerase sigma-70 factor (ECF subfamily)
MEQKEKFDKLYSISKSKLFNIAYSVTKNKEQAEDALQDAYIKAWKHFYEYDENKKFVNWMTTIVRNTAIDFNRTKSRKENTVSLSALTSPTNSSKTIFQIEDKKSNLNTIFEKNEQINDLYELINKLPDDMKNIMIGLASGDSYAEISKNENLAVSSVRAKAHRAKKILRKYSENFHIDANYHV